MRRYIKKKSTKNTICKVFNIMKQNNLSNNFTFVYIFFIATAKGYVLHLIFLFLYILFSFYHYVLTNQSIIFRIFFIRVLTDENTLKSTLRIFNVIK